MFAYCGNRPVNSADTGGTFWHVVIGASIGAVGNGLLTVLDNVTDGDPNTGWSDGVVLSLITGAVTGGVAVTGCGPVVQMAVNATVAAVEGLPDLIDDIRGDKNVLASLGEYAIDVGLSAVTSYSCGLGSKHATNLGKQTVKRTVNAFAHDGFIAGISEMGKATKWYVKSAKKLIAKFSKEQLVDTLKSGVNTVLENQIEIYFS